MSPRAACRIALLALCVLPLAARAQQGGATTKCNFTSDRASSDSTPEGRIGYLAGNVRINCPDRRITLRGDSAEQRPDGHHIIGHAVFDDPRVHVTSDFLNYFQTDERVIAVGNVNARLPNGSTLVGPLAEYRRAVPRIRPRAQMLARARPTITLIEKDSAGKPVEPTTVIAETVFMDGDSLIYANGSVMITRPDINATADSVFMDQTHETMRLMRAPKLEGKKERPFTLTGDLIDLYSKNKKLQRILSRGTAKAVSDSTTLTSDTLDLRVRNDLMDHAVAWGSKTRAHVQSPSQNLSADSLDVLMPGQRIQLVRALRRAFAEGSPDTTRFRLAKRTDTDWLRGDTIVARFDTLPAKDTVKKHPDVKLLTASGHASSYYHLAANDSAEKRPAINYVTARLINIAFDQSRVATVTTVDSVSGVYIEPKPDSTARRAVGATAAPAPAPSSTPGTTARPAPTSIIPLPPKKP